MNRSRSSSPRRVSPRALSDARSFSSAGGWQSWHVSASSIGGSSRHASPRRFLGSDSTPVLHSGHVSHRSTLHADDDGGTRDQHTLAASVSAYRAHGSLHGAFEAWQRCVQVERLAAQIRGALPRRPRYACLDCYAGSQPCRRHLAPASTRSRGCAHVQVPAGGLQGVSRLVRMLVMCVSWRSKARPLTLRMAILCEARWRAAAATSLQHWYGCMRTKYVVRGICARRALGAWRDACCRRVRERARMHDAKQHILQTHDRNVRATALQRWLAYRDVRVALRSLRRHAKVLINVCPCVYVYIHICICIYASFHHCKVFCLLHASAHATQPFSCQSRKPQELLFSVRCHASTWDLCDQRLVLAKGSERISRHFF